MVQILFLALSTHAALAGQDLFLSATEHESNARYGDAHSAWLACAEADEVLRPYAIIHAARCRLRGGQVEAGLAELAAFVQDYPDGPWINMARAELYEALLKQEERVAAAAAIAPVLDIEPQPWWMDKLAWNATENLLKIPGRETEAYAYIRHVVETTGYIAPRREASRRLLKSPNLDDRAAAIIGLLRCGEFTDAGKEILLSPAVLLGADGESSTLDALLALLKGGTSVDPAAALDDIAKVNGPSQWLQLWLLYAARMQMSAGRADLAEALTDALVKNFADTREAGDALWYLANYYEGLDRDAQAEAAYRRLADDCPDHFRADDALWAVAWKKHSAGNRAGAEATFEELGRRFPDSRFRAQALYMIARWRESDGDNAGAKAHYRAATESGIGDYYAHRALDRLLNYGETGGGVNLRVDASSSVLQPMSIPGSVPGPVADRAAVRPEFQRLYFFGRHGLEEGEWEAMHILRNAATAADPALVYTATADAGFAHTAWQFAIDAGWGIEGGQRTAARLRLDYPLAYWADMSALGNETRLDPFLLLSLAKQESTFRAKIESHAGASGVMQLMPATAKWMISVDDTVHAHHVANLSSPINSIRLGARYLMRMSERSDGNKIYALASYNGGPGNLDKWRKRFPNHDLDAFVEAIPFDETRGYVKKVLGNYAAYHSIYRGVSLNN